MTKAPEKARLTEEQIERIVARPTSDGEMWQDIADTAADKAYAAGVAAEHDHMVTECYDHKVEYEAKAVEEYKKGIADTEAKKAEKKDEEWHDGYDHGQAHERAAAEVLVATLYDIYGDDEPFLTAVAAYRGRNDGSNN